MTEPPTRPRPTMTDRTLAEKQARAERAGAALRANLRKRKDQARARTQDTNQKPDPTAPITTEESAD